MKRGQFTGTKNAQQIGGLGWIFTSLSDILEPPGIRTKATAKMLLPPAQKIAQIPLFRNVMPKPINEVRVYMITQSTVRVWRDGELDADRDQFGDFGEPPAL